MSKTKSDIFKWFRVWTKGFWGILKSEMYYLRKFSSKEELTYAIEFYNTKRCQLKLKCMTQMEYHSAAA